MLAFACTGCHVEIHCHEDQAGQLYKCELCQTQIQIPTRVWIERQRYFWDSFEQYHKSNSNTNSPRARLGYTYREYVLRAMADMTCKDLGKILYLNHCDIGNHIRAHMGGTMTNGQVEWHRKRLCAVFLKAWSHKALAGETDYPAKQSEIAAKCPYCQSDIRCDALCAAPIAFCPACQQQIQVSEHKGMMEAVVAGLSHPLPLHVELQLTDYVLAVISSGCEELEKGGYEEAIADFTHAITIYCLAYEFAEPPDYSKAHYWRACCYLKLKRYAESVDDFKIVIERDSQHVKSYIGQASAYIRTKKYREAFDHYGAVIDLVPQLVDKCDDEQIPDIKRVARQAWDGLDHLLRSNYEPTEDQETNLQKYASVLERLGPDDPDDDDPYFPAYNEEIEEEYLVESYDP
jgi:tetratricopeptide (TPR) repeat protein